MPLMRVFIGLTIAAAAAIVGFTVAWGITGSGPTAMAAAVVLAALAGWATGVRGLIPLDPQAASRGLKVVSGVATLAALVALTRLAVFMVDPSRVAYSVFPSSAWEVGHSCLTAYHVAARAAGEGSSPYDDALYSHPQTEPRAPRRPRLLGPFKVDVYEYPPPFLLLSRASALGAPDFMRLRPLWFGLNVGVVLIAMLVVARSLGPAGGTRALLLSPLVWASLPTLSALQKGNVQLLVVALSMAAMVLFAKRRPAAGGLLLAYAALSKLYPGMLGVYLLARRRWSALLGTAAAGAALLVATFLDVGASPFIGFVGHLPGLLSGEAFPAFRNPFGVAINFSVPGLVFKLSLFGLTEPSFGAAKVVGWVYTLLIVGATLFVARRGASDTPAVWMAILILATLRSPFLPQAYASFPPLWLLTLLAAAALPAARTLVLVVLAWVSLNVYVPMDWGFGPRALAIISALPQAVTVVLAVLGLRYGAAERSVVAADELAMGNAVAGNTGAYAPLARVEGTP